MLHLASGSDVGHPAWFSCRFFKPSGVYGIVPLLSTITLCPGGIANMAPSCQNAVGAAECPSRFQLAALMACQMPLRFGWPAIRFGRAADAPPRPRTGAAAPP